VSKSTRVLFTESFRCRWAKSIAHAYGYSFLNNFVAVRTIGLSKVHVYSPLLSYSDLTFESAQGQISSLPTSSRGFIPYLDFKERVFKQDDKVVMRLDIAHLSEDEVFKSRLNAKCRNQVRKSEKSNIRVIAGTRASDLDRFYALYIATMSRYGSPALPYALFQMLASSGLINNFYTACVDETPVASICVVRDGKLTWVPWGASDPRYNRFCPNHAIYWRAITDSIHDGVDVFDFGRSPYLGATYAFKKDWGAEPVKISEISNYSRNENVYSKYDWSSRVWKLLPSRLTQWLGPMLTKFLLSEI